MMTMMMMMMMNESKLPGTTEVFGQILSQCRFSHPKSHLTSSGIEPGPATIGSWRLTAEACYEHNCQYVKVEVITAVTTKNAVFWDIKPQVVLHSSPLIVNGLFKGKAPSSCMKEMTIAVFQPDYTAAYTGI
jgi:hypothetical protein